MRLGGFARAHLPPALPHLVRTIVGKPDRKYLWLLARSPVISYQLQAALTARTEGLGFDVGRLIKTARE